MDSELMQKRILIGIPRTPSLYQKWFKKNRTKKQTNEQYKAKESIFFCLKRFKFVYLGPYDVVQIHKQVTQILFESLKSLHTLFDTYLIGIWITCWGNLDQIVWSKMYKIFSFFDKKLEFFFLILFDKALTPFCKTFQWLKQLFNGKLLIFRLLSFSVSKIMAVRHV